MAASIRIVGTRSRSALLRGLAVGVLALCTSATTASAQALPLPNTGQLEVVLVEMERWFFPGAEPLACNIDILIRNKSTSATAAAYDRTWQLHAGPKPGLSVFGEGDVPTLAPGEAAWISLGISQYTHWLVGALYNLLPDAPVPIRLTTWGTTRAHWAAFDIPVYDSVTGYCNEHASGGGSGMGGGSLPPVP